MSFHLSVLLDLFDFVDSVVQLTVYSLHLLGWFLLLETLLALVSQEQESASVLRVLSKLALTAVAVAVWMLVLPLMLLVSLVVAVAESMLAWQVLECLLVSTVQVLKLVSQVFVSVLPDLCSA